MIRPAQHSLLTSLTSACPSTDPQSTIPNHNGQASSSGLFNLSYLFDLVTGKAQELNGRTCGGTSRQNEIDPLLDNGHIGIIADRFENLSLHTARYRNFPNTGSDMRFHIVKKLAVRRFKWSDPPRLQTVFLGLRLRRTILGCMSRAAPNVRSAMAKHDATDVCGTVEFFH